VLIEPLDPDVGKALADAAKMEEIVVAAGITLEQVHHGYDLACWAVNKRALERGHGIRTGLEDVAVMPDGTVTGGNVALVWRARAFSATFSSPLDDHINIKAVKEKCWPNAGKIKSVDVRQLIMNGDAIFVIADGRNTDGKLFRNCDYFVLKDGKISTYECFFGPGINYPTSGK
jgi:hypothetical protein